jgi:hypothetical protein
MASAADTANAQQGNARRQNIACVHFAVHQGLFSQSIPVGLKQFQRPVPSLVSQPTLETLQIRNTPLHFHWHFHGLQLSSAAFPRPPIEFS